MYGDKFSQDVLWNIVSLGIAGACGVAVNLAIGAIYGADALGVFNQVFAVYLVFSQLAVLGVHGSVLNQVAAATDDGERRAIVTSAMLVTLVQAVIMAGALLLIAQPAADLLDSPDVATGIWWVAPGLVCFALNKVVLACLNGLRHMRWYALFQACRVVALAIGFVGFALLDVRAPVLPVLLTVGEGVTLLLAIGTIRAQLGAAPAGRLRHWARVHLRFGVRAFPSGLFGELNTRIDVLILGVFVTDTLVGAYSLAALLAEGMFQILIALRSNYAPIVVRLLAERDVAELDRVVKKGRARTYAAAAALGAVAVLGYALVVPLLTSDPALERSWLYFAILMAGMVASAGYVPFNQMLLWGMRPGWHTINIVILVAASAAANAVLIGWLGVVGAAIATGAVYAGQVVLLKVLVARVLDIRI